MLGFAMRAGRLILGTELICTELQRKRDKIKLVLVSDTASEQTKKKLQNKCEFYKKNILSVDIDTDELGRMLGKQSPIAAVAVVDEGFAKEISASVGTDSLRVNSVTSEGDEASNRKEASK